MRFDINKVAKVTKPGEKPIYSHHGYVIDKDGTVYALYHKWWHGAIIALLYPEEASSFTMDSKRSFVLRIIEDDDGPYAETIDSEKLHWPETGEPEDVNVFAFQDFEHGVHRKLQLIRICPSRMSGPCSVDVPKRKMEPIQLQSLFSVMKVLGIERDQEVNFDHRDMTWAEAQKWLHNDEYVEDDVDNEPEDVDNEPEDVEQDDPFQGHAPGSFPTTTFNAEPDHGKGESDV